MSLLQFELLLTLLENIFPSVGFTLGLAFFEGDVLLVSLDLLSCSIAEAIVGALAPAPEMSDSAE